MAELFREVVCDLYKDGKQFEQDEKKNLISQITDNNNRITKAREYKLIKSEAEEKIVRLEAKLTDFTSSSGTSVDIDALVYKAIENLKKLDLLYFNADIERSEVYHRFDVPRKMDLFRNRTSNHNCK